jgi:rare lipoprotein A
MLRFGWWWGVIALTIAAPLPGDGVASMIRASRGPAEIGRASWYGTRTGGLHGERTASGERFDATTLTAAHRTYPFGTRLRVTNLANGLSIVVRVNDRGPALRERIIDVSRAAAGALGFQRRGTARVRIERLR